MTRPLLYDTLLPPEDWRGVNRHALRLDTDDLGTFDGIPGIPYTAEWQGEPEDRFLRVTLPGERVVEVAAIVMEIGAGAFPGRKPPAPKKKQKKAAVAPIRAQGDLQLL